MDESTSDSPTCLVCLESVGLLKKGDVVAPHRLDRHSIVDCRGTGYVPRQKDGRDDVRLTAIDRRHELMITIESSRAALRGALDSQGWELIPAMSYYGEEIARMETQAWLWKGLAEHGDYFKSLSDALNGIITGRGHYSTNREDFASLEVQGLRTWIIGVRRTLVDLAENQTNGETLATLISELF